MNRPAFAASVTQTCHDERGIDYVRLCSGIRACVWSLSRTCVRMYKRIFRNVFLFAVIDLRYYSNSLLYVIFIF